MQFSTDLKQNVKKVTAVKDVTYAAAKRKPESACRDTSPDRCDARAAL